MDKYMLFFRSGLPAEDAFQDLSPEQMQATSLDEAIEAAKGCPVFEQEGRVEVRPVQAFN